MDTMEKRLEAEGFTRDQIEEISKGREEGLDVTLYARKDFLAIQMHQIRLGLLAGIPAEKYAKTEYDWFQMEEIRKGLEEKIDIMPFVSPDISYDRMQQIRLGLKDGIDLSAYKRLDAGILKQMRLAIKNKVNIVPYIKAGYDADQLEPIREALQKKLDIDPWVQKEYRGVALREIFEGLENGLDVSVYANVNYNWQQMREIRLGIEHMVDVERYNSPFYSHGQMKEIRLGLEAGLDVSCYCSPMYTAAEMQEKRLALEEGTVDLITGEEIPRQTEEERAGLIEHGAGGDSAAQCYTVTLSDDEMEAYIEVSGSSDGFERVGIVKALQEKGICYGIRYDVIDDIVSGNSPRKALLIAGGRKLTDGKDGWYEFFFRTDLNGIPKELENGRLDYMDVEWFETVDKGQKLAVYHSAEKGEDGITVTGRIIPARPAKEKGLLVGRGFQRLADGKTYIADKHGIVTLQDYRLNVSEVLILQDVNMATGNVEYDGNIVIKGNVSSGVTIKASKDLIVEGYVEAARIICGGNVFLRKGMNGSGGGSIQATGDVIGYFFEEAEVKACGNIQGDYFFKSVLYAQGEIKAVGKKAMIAGGTVIAEKGLKTNVLGNPIELQTHVMLGGLKRIRQKEDKLDDAIREVNQELATLRNAHREFQKRYIPEIRNSISTYLKIESAIYTKERELEILLNDKSGIEEEIAKSGSVSAVVDGQLYEGVTIEIDGVRWRSKNLMDVTLRKIEDRVAVLLNHPINS